jgi:hypothetical protein
VGLPYDTSVRDYDGVSISHNVGAALQTSPNSSTKSSCAISIRYARQNTHIPGHAHFGPYPIDIFDKFVRPSACVVLTKIRALKDF